MLARGFAEETRDFDVELSNEVVDVLWVAGWSEILALSLETVRVILGSCRDRPDKGGKISSELFDLAATSSILLYILRGSLF